MTDEINARDYVVYFEPLTVDVLEKIIAKEKPEGPGLPHLVGKPV